MPPVMLTSDEYERCKRAISKLGKDDVRFHYLNWRLDGQQAGVIPKKKTRMAKSEEYKICLANLKNRDVLKWLSINLPLAEMMFTTTFSAGKSLNSLSRQVQKGAESLDRLTVWVLRAQSVMQMKELTTFEEAPRFMVYVTNLMDRDIHFISHKWYGNRPDNEEHSVLKYVQNLIKIGTKNGFKGIDEDDLIWIDYCCVPQQKQEWKMKELVKIPYLLNYSTVHIFAEHPEYERSVWCRLEQTVNAAIGPCRDLTDFWIQDPKDLLVLLPSLIQLDVAKMKIRAFMQIDEFNSQQEYMEIHPNYYKLDYLVPNNILLEMILYSLESLV